MARKNLTNTTDYTTGFTPVVFQPSVFQPIDFGEGYDPSILERRFAQERQAEREYAQAQAENNKALSTMLGMTHKDDHQWVMDYFNKITEAYKAYANIGDYTSATNAALIAGTKALATSEFIGHVTAKSEYDELIKSAKSRVNAGKVNRTEYEHWLNHKGKYNYKPRLENGQEIGGDLDVKTPLYDSIDFEQVAEVAFKLFNPDQKEWSKTNKTTGYETGEDNKSYISSSESHSKAGSKVEVTPEDLKRTFKEYYKDNDHWEALMQAYETARDKFAEDLNSSDVNVRTEAEERRRLWCKNGTFDLQSYLNDKIYDTEYAKTLAYRRTSSAISDDESEKPHGKGREHENDNPGNFGQRTAPGANVESNPTPKETNNETPKNKYDIGDSSEYGGEIVTNK